ncbi:Transposable element Tc1 transposase-like 7, partial [Homarus americanus]
EKLNTTRQIKESYPDLLQNVSVRSVSRYIQKGLDLPSRSAAKKPFLTACHTVNRVNFAKKYINWPLDKVHSILWSDVSTFTVSGTSFGRVCRPKTADRCDPKYTMVTHLDSVIVLGALSYNDNLEDCFDKCKADTF